MLNAAERETNTQLAAYQQGRADAMGAPRQGGPAQAAPQPAPAGGQAAGYQSGTQGPGSTAARASVRSAERDSVA